MNGYKAHCRRTHIAGRDDKAHLDAFVRGVRVEPSVKKSTNPLWRWFATHPVNLKARRLKARKRK